MQACGRVSMMAKSKVEMTGLLLANKLVWKGKNFEIVFLLSFGYMGDNFLFGLLNKGICRFPRPTLLSVTYDSLQVITRRILFVV